MAIVQERDSSQTGSCHLISFPSVSPDRGVSCISARAFVNFFSLPFTVGLCGWFYFHKSCKLEDRYLLLDVAVQLNWPKTILGEKKKKSSPDVQKAAGLTLCLQLPAKNREQVFLDPPHVWTSQRATFQMWCYFRCVLESGTAEKVPEVLFLGFTDRMVILIIVRRHYWNVFSRIWWTFKNKQKKNLNAIK